MIWYDEYEDNLSVSEHGQTESVNENEEIPARNVMCLSSFWTALQLLWTSVYVLCGATQLVIGIFFMVSVPALHFTSNLVGGFVNIVMGTLGGAMVCFGNFSHRRQEALLYIACSVLAVNLAATILREWGLYWQNLPEILKDHPHHLLIFYGCFANRVLDASIIIVSFLASQFAYCSMQIRPTEQKLKKEKAIGARSLDTIADGEYVISRQKPSKSPSKPHAIYDAYAQSWVFEADQAAASSNLENCTKIVKNGSPQNQSSQFHSNHNSYYTSVITEQTELLDTPVVHVEEASDDSTSNSDRKLFYMKSFSRATSPGPLSVSSSQNSLTLNPTSKPQIYEYLEKLTDPTVYRSRLNTALSDREEKDSTSEQTTSNITMQRMESLSPRYEKVQYASLIQELQKAIVNKKETISPQSNSGSVSTSDKTQTNSKSSSRHESSRSEAKCSDGDFSRELEAALQLIQDLESPNTIETSSETKSPADIKANERPISLWRDSNASIEGSDETQTGISSIGELMSPLSDHQLELRTFKLSGTGKGTSIIVHHPSSQSTSGYSSPIHPASSTSTTPQNWSTTSSINGSNNEIIQPVSYSIHNSKSTTVISLYTPNDTNQKAKSVTLVSITGDNNPVTPLIQDDGDASKDKSPTTTATTVVSQKGESVTPVAPNGWKSLLRKKRKAPKLCPELEGAIIKSESLAYLSEIELLARHQRNNEMHRKIEERVIQQLGVPRTESKC